MKLINTFIPAALVLVCSSGLAMAEERMDPANPSAMPQESTTPQGSTTAVPEFGKLDADRNGTISTSEATAFPPLVDAFPKADANTDGLLSQEEYAAIVPKSEDEGS
ncbi:MAG: hypothetical protein USCGTAYLOR_01843 [Chromatiales bacterium USCg_Taylor]|nr:MAG: hypothetical protein USCGTAYLOR_01843 [Chromatiales bacterium USCg_Taylor]